MFFVRSVEAQGSNTSLLWPTLQELQTNRLSHCVSISRGAHIAKVLGEGHQAAGGFRLKFAYLSKTEKYIDLAPRLAASRVPHLQRLRQYFLFKQIAVNAGRAKGVLSGEAAWAMLPTLVY